MTEKIGKKKRKVTVTRVLVVAAVAGAGVAFRRNIAEGLQQAAQKALYPEESTSR